MSEREVSSSPARSGLRNAGAPMRDGGTSARQCYGTITVIGGGCYGSYYVRQLARARLAGALEWTRLVVVDRDPDCRVVHEPHPDSTEVAIQPWQQYLARYLSDAASAPEAFARDAVVPSPLMPHLLFEWLVARAGERYPGRRVEIRPLGTTPRVPWERASATGETHYVSFAEWMCPVNCIEPLRCPKTRGARDWSMPTTLRAHVAEQRESGHNLDGPFVFHCVHRAYGVGMIDIRTVLDADRDLAAVADHRAAAFLVGTVSHCHGAIGVLSISA